MEQSTVVIAHLKCKVHWACLANEIIVGIRMINLTKVILGIKF